jgi:hypothetical protein
LKNEDVRHKCKKTLFFSKIESNANITWICFSIPAFCLNKQSIISQCEEAYKGSSKHLSLGSNSSHSSLKASLV